MLVRATYFDGQTADPRPVDCWMEGGAETGLLAITDLKLDHEIAHWQFKDLIPLPGRANELRLTSEGALEGARLVFEGHELRDEIRKKLPQLVYRRRRQRGRQMRLIGVATLALASILIAYIYGIPLLANHIVPFIPPATERSIGDTIVAHMSSALESTGGIEVCDADPNSLANTAIRRFSNLAIEGSDTPFELDVQVVRNTIPNAFALPGGRAFYFSGLLSLTQTADEFAGVLAHEIGHVVHRHGMKQLVSTASTGLLVGFVLGDATGLSVAGVVGAALIDTSFSRDDEREADQYALQTAQRVDFEAAGLAYMLERIEAESDSDNGATMALLNSHPLTQERQENLQQVGDRPQDLAVAFSEEEWAAIKVMCDVTAPGKTKTK